MTVANNAIYTPTPRTATVLVYEDKDGETHIESDVHQDHLISLRGGVVSTIRREIVAAISRGNLTRGGDCRWVQVQLADGSTGMVLVEGS